MSEDRDDWTSIFDEPEPGHHAGLDQERCEFLAMLAHEIRNPLAAIQTATAVLVREDVTKSTRNEASNIINRQFRHLHRIMENLLDASVLKMDRIKLEPASVDLIQLVRNAVQAAVLLYREPSSIRLDVPSEPMWVWGDTIRLEQAIGNLLDNALKFTGPEELITVKLSSDAQSARLVVSDQGPGIADDLLPHIFEPFTQGEQSLDRGKGGLGLGLTLTAHILRLHRGTIEVKKHLDGPGVSFVITLPLQPDLNPVAVVPPAAEDAKLRIVLVEDGVDARRMLAQILRLDGHTVFEATDGVSGLEMILRELPDYALIDIGLPVLDGYELARRARPELPPEVKLIAVTGYGLAEDIARARRAGFDSHLVKPVRYPDLLRVLRPDYSFAQCE